MRAVMLFVLLFSLSAHAGRGGMVGNGGDAVLQEFNLRGIQLAAYLHAEPAVASKFGIDADKFLAVVKSTALAGEDHLILNGVEVDAINYPSEPAIEVSRTRWAASATRMDAYFVQRRIALHEYLWIYGIDDTGYAVSNPIIAEIEKVASPVLDPSVQQLLRRNFCDKVAVYDFTGAERMLALGLDLNIECQGGNRHFATEMVLDSWTYSGAGVDKSARLSLLRSMLKFGANPNQLTSFGSMPILVRAMEYDLVIAKLFLEFGADPNWFDRNNISAFASIAETNKMSRPEQALDVTGLELLLKAGGDVNLSGSDSTVRTPADVIVSKEENADVVEALIQSGKVNWCIPPTFGWVARTIDGVRSEYQPLLAKYAVRCGRFRWDFGRGMTCDEAIEDGKKKCAGYKHVVINTNMRGGEICAPVTGSSGDKVTSKFMTSVSCMDDEPAH